MSIDPPLMRDFDLLSSPVEDLAFSKADFSTDPDCGSMGQGSLLLPLSPRATGKLPTC